jgi:hypothetical protein
MGVGTFASPRATAYSPADTAAAIAAYRGARWPERAATRAAADVIAVTQNSVVL